ncbi:MAG: N-acetylmuramoyl-L-alanine amidase [Deltaproteobacteria bacterium]
MEKIICINPGHGGSDPGASASGINEKDINLLISLYQEKRFTELGWKVILTRSSDVNSSLSDSAKIVLSSKAPICLSNHCNAASSADASGFEAIYSLKSDGKLAKMIFDNIVSTGIMKGRSIYTRESTQSPNQDYFFIIRETPGIETIIIEYGFMTNAGDLQNLLDPNKHSQLAEAVVKAVCSFSGAAYTPPIQDPDAWKKADIDELAKAGLISNPDYWKQRVNESMPVWATMALVNRLRKMD